MFHALLLAAALAPPTPLPRPFGSGHAFYHPTETAPYRYENTILRLRFDFAHGIVFGHETAIVRPKRTIAVLPFDGHGLHFTRIDVDGAPVRYTVDERQERIELHLRHPVVREQRVVVDFDYSARPERGMYFVRPDAAYPKITPEIWTQGEPTDNRDWFPTWDQPNNKTPSELVVTVPSGWSVIGNGYLRAHTHSALTETWDWNAPRPKATYLISFAAGPLVEHHTTLGALNVDSYVQPRYAALNAICFGRTNETIAFYQRTFGVAFPWEKYDQTTAERYTFGGMEDASATLQTVLALHPRIEDTENSCDGLVTHELVQQWFGDDASFVDWSNSWLGEGFATYFQLLWSRYRWGEAEYEYERYQALQAYYAEAAQYVRPIVDYSYSDPIETLDSSAHERAGAILYSLRAMLGDKRFFDGLRIYLKTYQRRNTDTRAFFASVGKTAQTNLDWFADEWFYRPAFPHYVVSYRYQARNQMLTIHVAQHNSDGKPFRMPILIEAYAGGRVYRTHSWIDRNAQTVRIDGVPFAPNMVLFDPNDTTLKTLTFAKPVAELSYQLAHAPHIGDREWALQQLTAAHAVASVREAVLSDPFYGIRADAVTDAATLDDAPTVAAALRDDDVRVRISAANAAGMLHTGSPVIGELEHLTGDPNPDVASAALEALGHLKAPGAYERLQSALGQRSFGDAIASAALQGLAAYGDPRALPLIRAHMPYGVPDEERNAAIVAFAQLSAATNASADAVAPLTEIARHDPLFSSRLAALRALGILGDPTAISDVTDVEHTDSQELVRLTAWETVLEIRDAVAARAYRATAGKSTAGAAPAHS